jgi:hypothetical protein
MLFVELKQTRKETQTFQQINSLRLKYGLDNINASLISSIIKSEPTEDPFEKLDEPNFVETILQEEIMIKEEPMDFKEEAPADTKRLQDCSQLELGSDFENDSENSSFDPSQINDVPKFTINKYKGIDEVNLKHPCPYCDRKYAKYVILRSHLLHLHSDKVENYPCTLCSKKFYLKSNLESHLKNHQSAYKCSKCPATFPLKRSLDSHRRFVHPTVQREFFCEVCGVAKKTKQEIKCHLISHSEERNHICSICGSKFKTKSQLMVKLIYFVREAQNAKILIIYISIFSTMNLHIKNQHLNVQNAHRFLRKSVICLHTWPVIQMSRNINAHMRAAHMHTKETRI